MSSAAPKLPDSEDAVVLFLKKAGRRSLAVLGALGLTLLCFIVLPIIQALHVTEKPDSMVRKVDTGAPPPPPPPPPEPEMDRNDENVDPPPQLDTPNLDFASLDMALDPGFGSGWMAGAIKLALDSITGGGNAQEALKGLAGMDTRPRLITHVNPVYSPQMQKKAPGDVFILLVIDENGQVVNPVVESSTDPVFVTPALNAIRKWKYEPAKRDGKPIRSRTRQQISFPKV